MAVTVSRGATVVTVLELVEVDLRRPLRRESSDVLNTASYRITAGTPGKRRGTLTYLCATLADALALDVLYQGTASVTLNTGAGVPLDGFVHVAVGELGYRLEKPMPGKLPKWSLRVDVREV